MLLFRWGRTCWTPTSGKPSQLSVGCMAAGESVTINHGKNTTYRQYATLCENIQTRMNPFGHGTLFWQVNGVTVTTEGKHEPMAVCLSRISTAWRSLRTMETGYSLVPVLRHTSHYTGNYCFLPPFFFLHFPLMKHRRHWLTFRWQAKETRVRQPWSTVMYTTMNK